jgi:carboxypeptidase family protein
MLRTALPRFAFSLLALLALSGHRLAFGQANTATVYGNVSDQSGAAVANAAVSATNTLTGAQSSTTSNTDGQFTFNFLPVGRYTFSAQLSGFQTQVRNEVVLSAGETTRISFQMSVSNLKESVTVSGEATLLNTESAEQHLTIEALNIHELPLAREDWTGLLKLGNGVASAGNNGVALNGLPPAAFNLTVDGTNASPDPELPSVGFYQGFNVINTVNSDAIAEVSTTKGIAPASVSGTMSGNVNLITKNGTNQFHGTVLEINSAAAYNARNQFLTKRPASRLNQFGGSLGGPIFKDKLFFFGNYQGARVSTFAALNGTVPTPGFASLATAAVPQYAKVLSAFPLPNQPYAPSAQTAQFVGTGALVQNDNNAVARFDYYASSKNLFTVRYSRARPFKDSPTIIPINPRISTGHNDTYNAQFTHSEATWTFVTRFGFNRIYIDRLDAGYGAGLDQVQFGFNSSGAEAFVKRGGTYTWEQTAAKTVGRHAIQFGGILQRTNAGRTDDNTNGFNYASLADFLANIPNTVTLNFPHPDFLLHTYQFGGFVQDDFRLAANLTINLGLRYDYFTVPKERDGLVFNRNPSALGPGFGDFRPASSMYNSDWPNFAPRFGFAWSLGSDRKTVVRGGSGLFFNPHTIFGGPIEEVLAGATLPFRVTLSRAQALGFGINYPVDRATAQQKVVGNGTPQANTSISPNFPNPYSIQWNLSAERQISGGMVLEVAYVGNRGLHLNMVRMENLANRLTGISPNPAFGQFRYYDTSDASWYNALQTSLKKRYSSGLTFGLYYTYANNMSYGDADLQLNNVPQDNNNLRADKGPTPYDIRHNFSSNFVYEIPFSHWLNLNGRTGKLLADGWQLSGVLTASTGAPYNVTDSRSAYPNSRPDIGANLDPTLDNYTGTLQLLNPTAFLAVPIIKASGAQTRPGDLGRYAVRGPGQWTLDASLGKNFAITERVRLQLRGDAFNSLNHTNLSGLVTDLSKSNFGRLTSATARSIQIGAKIVF